MTMKEFKETLKGYIGDRTDDDTLSLLEQLDTVEVPSANDHAQELEETKQLLQQMTQAREDVEREWREKYRDRFFGGGDEGGADTPPEDETKVMTVDEAATLWLKENGNHYQ